ncbi:MAG: glycosyltransferase family 1 protein, partial [Thermotogaceae bacterium]|nr:glycosyltransferase family 1 protein [Thermotogaceae bacterium]
GLPVVATSNGGPSESLNENGVEYGVLVDPADTQDISRGLKRLINCDQAVWKSFRERAMDRVMDKYTWAATAKGYLDAIKELIKSTYPEPEIPDYIYTGIDVPFIE